MKDLRMSCSVRDLMGGLLVVVREPRGPRFLVQGRRHGRGGANGFPTGRPRARQGGAEPPRAAANVLARPARDGAYHSQFVTGTGNGGLTARPGVDRRLWESGISAGPCDEAPGHELPVHGALNFRGQVAGAAPRFGSGHFRPRAATLARATFRHPDSAAAPADFGGAAGSSLTALAEADEQDALGDNDEAHAHDGVGLDRDAEALVLDACYRGTPVEAAARRLPCRVEWHPGHRLTVAGLRRRAAAADRSTPSPAPGSPGRAWSVPGPSA